MEIEGEDEEVIKTYSIEAPGGFDIVEKGSDVLLEWYEVADAKEYKVYWSDDRASLFPDDWNYALTVDTEWTHEGVMDADGTYFYIVRGVNDGVEGQLSDMGYKTDIELLNRDQERSWNWISLPYHDMDHNGDGEYTALDIVEMIEGDRGSSEIINSVARYNNSKPYEPAKSNPYYNPSYYPIMNYTEEGWENDESFEIRMGDAIGLNTTANHTWRLCGVEDRTAEVQIYEGHRQYSSIPYTYHDIRDNGEFDTFDVVEEIEGDLFSTDKLDRINDWDPTGQAYTNITLYSPLVNMWFGEFPLQSGDVIGFRALKNFTWQPTMMSLQPPRIKNITQNTSAVPLASNITIEFTEQMNKTSVEENIRSEDFEFSTDWMNNHTLEIIPDRPFEPESEYELKIDHLAKDVYGNFFDGDANGIASRTSEDDHILTFTSETYPEIEHDSPSRWHMEDDITLTYDITDDVAVENAYLNYTDVDGTNQNVSLDLDDQNIMIPAQNGTGGFAYYFWAVDESGLTTKSETYSIDILDLEPPYIKGITSEKDFIAIDGRLALEFSKPMNYTSIGEGIEITPHVDHVVERVELRRFEINLTKASAETSYSIIVDADIVEDIRGINLEDNYNTTFTTESPPQIEYEQNNTSICKSSNISISANFTDVFGVDNAHVEYTCPNGYVSTEELQQDEDRWICTLPRQNSSGQFVYRFIAEDSSGLTTESENYTLDIINPTDIRFKNISAEEGDPFEFSVEITNPVGVQDVKVHYEENGVERTETLVLREGNAGDGVWFTEMEISSVGESSYSIVVTDLDDETIVKSSPNNIVVEESSMLSDGFLLYLLPLLAIAAAIGGILYYKGYHVEDISEEEDIETKSTEEQTQDHEVQEENNCTICFGELDGEGHTCSGCGNRYHLTCMTAIGECPICGNKDLNELGVDDGREE